MCFLKWCGGARAVLAVFVVAASCWAPAQAEISGSSKGDRPIEAALSGVSGERDAPGSEPRSSAGAVEREQHIFSASNPVRDKVLTASVELDAAELGAADPVFSVVEAVEGASVSEGAVQDGGDGSTLSVIWLALSALLGFGVVARRGRIAPA